MTALALIDSRAIWLDSSLALCASAGLRTVARATAAEARRACWRRAAPRAPPRTSDGTDDEHDEDVEATLCEPSEVLIAELISSRFSFASPRRLQRKGIERA